jgi:hypothetical protein
MAFGATLAAGCSAIVGIKDLPADGGTGEGTENNSTAAGGSSAGSSTAGATTSASTVTRGGSSAGSSTIGATTSASTTVCAPPSGAACQIDPQCGCPAGYKCDFETNPSATCVVAGSLGVGAVCTATTDCAAGLTCGSNLCHPFCDTPGAKCTGSSPYPLGTCLQITSNSVTVPQDALCLFQCTPSPNDCPAGQGCVILTTNGQSYSNCQIPGTGIPGDTCTSNADCAAGTGCFNTSTGLFCVQYCRADSDCADLSGTQCDLTNFATPVDGVTYGVCDQP